MSGEQEYHICLYRFSFSLHIKSRLVKENRNYYNIPSLTVEKQKNGCKASKINACSRFLFRNDMCYCAIFFTLW